MKRLICFILIITFLVLINSCDYINNSTIISNAENCIFIHPDSAMLILQSIEYPNKLKDSTKASYWLAIGQTHYNTRNAMIEDSMLLYALDYYQKGKNTKRLMQSYFLSAQYYMWVKNKDKALALLNSGLKIAEEQHDTAYIVNFYNSLGKIELENQEYERCIDYLKKMSILDTDNQAQYYRNLGLISSLSHRDSSIYYFNKGIDIALTQKDSILAFQIKNNLADALNDMGKTTQAIKTQEEILSFSPKYAIDKPLAYLSMSGYYINLNKLDSAEYYMGLVQKSKVNNDMDIDNYFTIQRIILDYAKKERFITRDINLYINHINENFHKKEKERIEQTYKKNILEQQNFKLTISRQKTQFTISIALFFLLIFISISVFLFHKKRKKIQEKDEELEVLKRLIRESERSATDNSKDDRFFKRILLQQLGIIRLVATTPTAQNQELLHQMIQVTNENIPVDTLLVWDDLYSIIDSIHNSFYTKTINKYGDILIDKEIQLCCLLAVGFSTKEISIVTRQSLQTLYQRKTNIRKKLNMEEKGDIVDFLERPD